MRLINADLVLEKINEKQKEPDYQHPEEGWINGLIMAEDIIEKAVTERPLIYEIMMFENPDKELVYQSGKKSGFPDEGCIDNVGFYYDINDAIEALNSNTCDIRECMYNAAFIVCRKPGLYQLSGKEDRKYFVWSEEKQGFFEAEEPEIFAHVAY